MERAEGGTNAQGVAVKDDGRAGSLRGVTELVLVRHGESQGNVAATLAHEAGAHVINVPARDADVELSDTGRDQALALGRLLSGVPGGPAHRRLVLALRPGAPNSGTGRPDRRLANGGPRR